MTEAEKPKRPWFRFHLFTLVLMAVAIGALRWANSIPIGYGGPSGGGPRFWKGWPLPFYDEQDFFGFNAGKVFIDVLCWIPIIIAIPIVSEYIIRRREVHKT